MYDLERADNWGLIRQNKSVSGSKIGKTRECKAQSLLL